MKKIRRNNPIFIVFLLFFSFLRESIAQENKVEFKYKKYEKFDFEDLVIEGEVNSPSELSIFPRYEKKFKNILPYRKNFNLEIKRSIERLRWRRNRFNGFGNESSLLWIKIS